MPEETKEFDIICAKLTMEIQGLRGEITSLREEFKPVLDFYLKTMAIGWFSRLTLYVIGAILAIIVASLTVIRSIK